MASVRPSSSLAAAGGAVVGGGATTSGTSTVLLTRHDLMLDEDLPRALEAYFAVDEHRVMSVSVPEGEELFRLMSIKRDSASLLRAKSTLEDDVAVAHLRHTGLSLELALDANARNLIGALLPIPVHEGGVRRRSLAITPSGGGTSPVVRRRSSLARRASSSLVPVHGGGSTASSGGIGCRISFLCVMRLLFPSYPKKVVEKVVMAALPHPPVVPPAPVVDDSVRLLFRSCRSSAGMPEDSDNGCITFQQLCQHCQGIDAHELEVLVLRHSDLMRRYALVDLKAFEDLHVYDLLRRAGLPVASLQGHRYTPPLSILNMMRCWGALRGQLAVHLNGAQETRLSQLYVFLCQYGAPAAFRVEWAPIPSEGSISGGADAPPPLFNISVAMGCGVDGFARPTCNVNDVTISIEQLACIVASPHHPKIVHEPVLASQAAAIGSGAPGAAEASVTYLGQQQQQAHKQHQQMLALAAPGLCMPTAAIVVHDAPGPGSSKRLLGEGEATNTSSRCVSGMVGLGALESEAEIFAALAKHAAATPTNAGAADPDACLPRAPLATTPPRRTYPHQSMLRLFGKAQQRRDVVRKVNAAFVVPFKSVVQSLGACAYHDIVTTTEAGRSGSTEHPGNGRDGGANGDVLVLSPRPRGTNAVRPLSAYQRECTPTLFNYSGLEPPIVPTRPCTRPNGAGTTQRRRIGDRSMTHAVSRPLGFTGVVLSAEMMASPPSSPRFRRNI